MGCLYSCPPSRTDDRGPIVRNFAWLTVRVTLPNHDAFLARISRICELLEAFSTDFCFPYFPPVEPRTPRTMIVWYFQFPTGFVSFDFCNNCAGACVSAHSKVDSISSAAEVVQLDRRVRVSFGTSVTMFLHAANNEFSADSWRTFSVVNSTILDRDASRGLEPREFCPYLTSHEVHTITRFCLKDVLKPCNRGVTVLDIEPAQPPPHVAQLNVTIRVRNYLMTLLRTAR